MLSCYDKNVYSNCFSCWKDNLCSKDNGIISDRRFTKVIFLPIENKKEIRLNIRRGIVIIIRIVLLEWTWSNGKVSKVSTWSLEGKRRNWKEKQEKEKDKKLGKKGKKEEER